MPLSFHLSDAAQRWLSKTARLSITTALAGRQSSPPEPGGDDLAAADRQLLARVLGSFVTLTLQQRLRGCIGTILGHEPLYANVWRMARAAAFEDPRFPPLRADEWLRASVAISVLDAPTPCPDPLAVEVGRHGLILQHQGHTGIFLPQVPVEQGWDRTAYLENLCHKAGLPPGTWQNTDAKLFWYEAQVFPA